MALAATIVAVLAIAGAFASWAAGAIFFIRAMPEQGRRNIPLAIVAWPFITGRLSAATAEQASPINKALVAFFVCLTIAAAATSLATNLSRLSR